MTKIAFREKSSHLNLQTSAGQHRGEKRHLQLERYPWLPLSFVFWICANSMLIGCSSSPILNKIGKMKRMGSCNCVYICTAASWAIKEPIPFWLVLLHNPKCVVIFGFTMSCGLRNGNYSGYSCWSSRYSISILRIIKAQMWK